MKPRKRKPKQLDRMHEAPLVKHYGDCDTGRPIARRFDYTTSSHLCNGMLDIMGEEVIDNTPGLTDGQTLSYLLNWRGKFWG